MRKLSVALLFILTSIPSLAQNISRFEYFFDSEPGYGAGTIVNITPAATVTDLNIPISTSSLSTGFHILYVRAQNVSSQWTHTHQRSVYIAPLAALSNISQIEYFIDNDPGFGLGTQVAFTAAPAITNLPIDILAAPLTPGLHILYVRSKSSDGQWTHTHQRTFYIAPVTSSINISQIEYFIDNDPGIGLGTQVAFTAAPTLTNLPIDISAASLTPGLHILYVRSKSSDGQWTHTHQRSFYVANVVAAQNLVKFEYFFDVDPGFDNGITAAVAPPAPSVNNQDIFADVSSLSTGTHTFFIRAKDSGGEWTQVNSGTFTVTAAAPPTIVGFTPTNGPAGTTVTISGSNFTGATGVTFGGTPATSFSVLGPSTITAVVGTGTSGVISVTSPAGIATSSSSFTVTVLNTIVISPQPTSISVCDGVSATFTTSATGTTNLSYQWQFSSTLVGTYNDISNGGGYSNAGTPTLSVNTTGNFGAGFYRCKVSGDFAVTEFTNPAQLTVNPIPNGPTVTGASRCGNGSVTLTASGGSNGQYKWFTVATGGTPIVGEVNNSYITPSLSSTTSYFVSLTVGGCESTRTSVTATINPLPAAPSVTGANACLPSASVTLNASGGTSGQYRWYTVPTGGTAIAGQTNPSYITPNLSTTTTFYVSIDNGTCESTRTAVVATIQACSTPPTIATQPLSTPIGSITKPLNLIPLITTFNNSSISSITITAPPASGAKATIANGFLTIDYTGIAFSGTDKLTIRACDANGNCATQEFSIDVFGDIVIFNALSPNGANPTFFIQFIDAISETKNNIVTIFDRWQNEVWRGENYDNTSVVFKGTSNEGNDLPTGTYFYKIEFGSGKKPKTGFISLKR